MKTIKGIIKFILDILNQLLYTKFNVKEFEYNKWSLFKTGIIQKIIGINRKTPWPVHWSSQIHSPEKIQWGTRAPGLSMGCFFYCCNGIIIKDNVRIGPRVSLISINHDIYEYENYINDKPIIIGNNCWIGANVVILPGVELGEHTVVAAGSVVTKSFSEGNRIIGGNPARVITEIAKYNAVKIFSRKD